MTNKEFWNGKKVLVTGHTGFKGSWLSLWLIQMGAEVAGYALDPYTERDNFVVTGLKDRVFDVRGDVSDREKLGKAFKEFQPEIVFHLAAQPLVRVSYERPVDTYQTNLMGTLYVLECIRETESVREAVLVTTDKVYENKEQIWGYRENDSFGGYDPYSSSKACAEILINSYRNSYFNPKGYEKHGKKIVSVRAGNVIGGGDWSKDRLIPDCIRAMEEGREIEIRNPNAVRPWQHVLDALSGYLLLAERMWEDKDQNLYGGGWNFGPEYDSFATVLDVVEKIISVAGEGKVHVHESVQNFHEANLLFLDITKAKIQLGWHPRWGLEDALQKTVEWYQEEQEGKDMYEVVVREIKEYVDFKIEAEK